jgi:sugar phosphate isomerase/epimerase
MERPDMNVKPRIGLCCGSLVQADFRGLAEAAAAAGFSYISLWPTLFYGALEAGLIERDMRHILEDNGLTVSELDPLSSWLPVELDPEDLAAAFHAFTEIDFYRIADALGGRTLNIIQQGESTVSDERRLDLIRGLCDRATEHALKVTVEFLPWSVIGSLRQAQDLVVAVDHPNFGINIDTWHHFRSGGCIEQLATLDPATVAAVQFNDLAAQPWDNLIEETSMGRLPPGEGCSNSVAVYTALRSAGVDIDFNVEVFSSELMALPASAAAERLSRSMRAVIAGASIA